MELLRKKIARFVTEHGLCRPGDALIVAVSGGADSMALLDILAHLPGFDLKLVVAHLNHRLRGGEADADEEFARAAAERYGCPFEQAAVAVAELAAERGLSLEEAGREARYAFLQSVAGKYAAVAIAVGHHMDDQAETALMRLLRGAGGHGLAGMRPRNRAATLVRPLLCVRRREIETYLHQRGLTWREDSSNADAGFLRNRIRHELLPFLTKYNPEIVVSLNQTAAVLAADEELLDTVVAEVFTRTATVGPACVTLDLDALSRETVSLRKRLYRLAIQTVKGDLRRISFKHLASIDRQVYAVRPNSELSLPGGITVLRAYRLLRFSTGREYFQPAADELTLDLPGLYPLPCGGRLLLEKIDGPVAASGNSGPAVLSLPAGQLQPPLKIRYFCNGDRFTPLGMTGSKKLKDLFSDRKIPVAARRRIPLLLAGGEIVWVCGVQAAAKTEAATAAAGLPWIRLTFTAADNHLTLS